MRIEIYRSRHISRPPPYAAAASFADLRWHGFDISPDAIATRRFLLRHVAVTFIAIDAAAAIFRRYSLIFAADIFMLFRRYAAMRMPLYRLYFDTLDRYF